MSTENKNTEEEKEDLIPNIKDKAKGYLNGHSKVVFKIMVGLLVISIICYIVRFTTREKAEISIPQVYDNVRKDVDNSFDLDHIEYEKFTKYKDIEKEIDFLLEKEILTEEDSLRIKELYKEIKNIQ